MKEYRAKYREGNEEYGSETFETDSDDFAISTCVAQYGATLIAVERRDNEFDEFENIATSFDVVLYVTNWVKCPGVLAMTPEDAAQKASEDMREVIRNLGRFEKTFIGENDTTITYGDWAEDIPRALVDNLELQTEHTLYVDGDTYSELAPNIEVQRSFLTEIISKLRDMAGWGQLEPDVEAMLTHLETLLK